MTRRIARCEFNRVRPHLSGQDIAILEIGAGMGALANCFRESGWRNYTAVEPNPTMREHLTNSGIPTRAYLVPDLHEPDEAYDLVMLNDVFEHLNDVAAADRLVAEVRRVLRPGGLLCIASPDYNHWGVDFFNADFSHSHVTTVRRTVQICRNHDIEVVAWTYLSGFVTGPLATVLSLIVRLVSAPFHSPHEDSRLYRLKLTLLRRFLLVGVKR